MKFMQNKNEAALNSQVEIWYNANNKYIQNLCLGYPEAQENYHRNQIMHHKNYDVFIHTMNGYGHTALHGHGLNEVNIISIDSGLSSVDFQAKESNTTDERKLVTLDKFNQQTATPHAITEKALDVDMIHYVYNSTNQPIRFLEIYIDEPPHLPIYFPVLNNKENKFITFYPSKYGYQINKDLFNQIEKDSTRLLQSKSCNEIESYLINTNDISTQKFILTNSDTVIINNEGVAKYCEISNSASVFNLMYNKKVNTYLIDQSL